MAVPATLTQLLLGMATAIRAAAAKQPNALALADEDALGYRPFGVWTAAQEAAYFKLTPAARLAYFAAGKPYYDYEAAKLAPGQVAQNVVDHAKAAADAAKAAVDFGVFGILRLAGIVGVGWLALQVYRTTQGR